MAVALNTPVRSVQALLMNAIVSQTVLSLNGNAIKVVLRLENSGACRYTADFPAKTGLPISSGGSTGSIIGDGEFALSAPFGNYSADFLSGTIHYRMYSVVNSGEKTPYTSESADYAGVWNGQSTTDVLYAATNNTGSDQTQTTLVTGAFTSPAYAFTPIAFIGEQIIPVPVVGIFGDSIAAGNTADVGRGYFGQCLQNLSLGWHNNGVNASLSTGQVQFEAYSILAKYIDYAILQTLTNDFNTASITTTAAAQTAILNLCKMLGSSTTKIILCTVPPNTTSTDAWATPLSTGGSNNQTVKSWENLRVTWNNLIRDRTSTGMASILNGLLSNTNILVAGSVDSASPIEVNSDGTPVVLDGNGQQTLGTGGYWHTTGANTFTSDGVHMLTAANAPIVAAMQPKLAAICTLF
jgi:hypothetical protein